MSRHTQLFKFRPRVKQRPRMTRRGRVFTPQPTLDFERAVKENWNGPCLDVPCSMTITLYPDSFRVTVSVHPDDTTGGPRGDIDNYAKAIMDGLNKVAYTDDKLVRRLVVEKNG